MSLKEHDAVARADEELELLPLSVQVSEWLLRAVRAGFALDRLDTLRARDDCFRAESPRRLRTIEFVINLKTAKALGLTIPPSPLRADQLIE